LRMQNKKKHFQLLKDAFERKSDNQRNCRRL
jgi:hypothetical protein